jgi:hypothetical protein
VAAIPFKIPRLREEQRILPTFTPEQMKKIATWKPKGFCPELRRHLWRWRQLNRWDYVFTSAQGRHITHRNTLRDVRDLC